MCVSIQKKTWKFIRKNYFSFPKGLLLNFWTLSTECNYFI